MRKLTWSVEKNRELKSAKARNVCFEDIAAAIDSGGLLDEIAHPNADKYPHQRILVVRVHGYLYGVPCVTTVDGLFLKTAYPSRRLKKLYQSGKTNDQNS